MSPEEIASKRRENHTDAILSFAGLVVLGVLSVVHEDWPAVYVVGGIVALAVRTTGLAVNAARLRSLGKSAGENER